MLAEELLQHRTNGILLPLSAMRSARDWGVGDFESLKAWMRFLSAQGTKFLQILPLQETSLGMTCPYAAMSAFATDPVYMDMDDVDDIKNSAPAQQKLRELAENIRLWRNAARAPFGEVKDAKLEVLRLGYHTFLTAHAVTKSARFRAFEAYCAREQHWLKDYAVFRALKEVFNWQTWTAWPEKLRDFDAQAVEEFRAQYRELVDFYAYLQWLLDGQLRKAKLTAQMCGMYIFGDIPFATNLDSAEVWAERENFRLGAEIGAPADQFSRDGQRWGLPAYDWDYIAAHDWNLWRRKIRRVTELYDIFRLDHLVGFYRTYVFTPENPKGAFDLPQEQDQITRGKHFLEMVLQEAQGKLPVGEDLGVIPNYVRRMLVDLRIPGYKVLRWEREDNGYYREPRNYPQVSLATTSTHDTETLRGWWETMDINERRNIWEMISAQKTDGNVPFNLDTQRAILRRVLDSNSALSLFAWQDITGSLARINTPGTVSEDNWTYRTDTTPENAAEKYGAQLQMYRELLAQTHRAE
jgi:4-alpha-glucanotransferase